MKIFRIGCLVVFLPAFIACVPNDSQAPMLSSVRVNGASDSHHHAFSGQQCEVQVNLEDDRALRQVKITLEGGLHHGVSDPENPFFKAATLSNWSWIQTGEVFGKSDVHLFQFDIPWEVSGPYTLQVAAIDEEGNESDQAYHIDLISDSLPVINVYPAVPFLAESTTLILQTAQQLNIEGYTLDLNGLALVRQAVRNASGLTVWQNEIVVPGENVFQLADHPFAATIEPGIYSYVIQSTNISGLINSKTATVRVVE